MRFTKSNLLENCHYSGILIKNLLKQLQNLFVGYELALPPLFFTVDWYMVKTY